MDEFRLALGVQHADGSTERFAGDEADGRNVLQGGSFGTVSPGGFGEFSGTLARDIVVDRIAALERFDTLFLYGAGARAAWEGYDIAVPASKGDGSTISITGTGWSQSLADDASLAIVFVTGDLGVLSDPPLLRRLAIAAVDVPYQQDFQVASDVGGLSFDGSTGKAIDAGSFVEQWATAPGATKFGAFAYASSFRNYNTDGNDCGVTVYPSDDETTFDTGIGVPSGSITVVSLATARKYLDFMAAQNTSTTPTKAFHHLLTSLAFYGNHGLSTVPITGEAPGILASDAIDWAVANGAPWLTRNIQASSFAVPELSFPDGASAQDIIEAANAYEVWDYFVWEGPTFYYQPRGTGRTWHVRTDEGAVLSETGEQASDTWTGVAVFYAEPTGEQRSIGPPSLTGRFDYTDSTLEITDSSNPAVAHGRTRIARLNLSFPTTRSGATQIGAAWLEDMASVEVQGSVTKAGWVRDEAGIPAPAWLMRAGDSVVIDDVSAKVRQIVETTYDIDSRQLTATLDSPPHRIEAYLERLAVRTLT